MPRAAPIHSHQGFRTVAEKKRTLDQRRRNDPGRMMRKRIYASPQWKQLRALVKMEQPWCPECKPALVPWSDLDHVVDVVDGGAPFERDNVVGLCHRHHSMKTARTQGFQK